MCQTNANNSTDCSQSLWRSLPRQATTLLIGVGAVLAAQLSSLRAVHADHDSRPNIILIMSDDMGFSDIGCYGGEINTPTLDSLAAGGLRFTQFYNTSRCCPTRASLLTGLYPHQAGVGWMMTDRGYDGYRGDLNRNCRTIAEVLRPAGYSTYMAGKWHVTPDVKPDGPKDNWPLQRGFDRFYGTIHGAGSFYDPNSLTRDNSQISPNADPEYKPEQYYYTHAISDHAVRFLSEHESQSGDKPFFLYVAYTAAHWPMHALEQDIAKYRGRYDEGYTAIRKARLAKSGKLGLIDTAWQMTDQAESWEQVTHREWEIRCMEVYAAMVDSMDQGIGRIVDTLRKANELDNTLIFFLQDNGGCAEGLGRSPRDGLLARPDKPTLPVMAPDELQTEMIPRQTRDGYPTVLGPGIMPGPDGTYIAYGRGWANVSNTPFREYKHWVHEGGISTPLIAHWPARIRRATNLEHQPGHLIDIMATCVDVAQAEYPTQVAGQAIKPLEGVSLVPTFMSRDLNRTNPIFWEHEGNRAIRDGKWKLVAKENMPWELYDMAADRTEVHDLSEAKPELTRSLAAKWDSWAERANVLPLGAWKGNPKQSSFNKQQRKFQLRAGDDLPREAAPFVEKRSVKINAHISEATDGVIVAHGGTSDGYALYIKDRILTFATRHQGALTRVTLPNAFESSSYEIEVVLSKSGNISLRANGQLIANGQAPDVALRMPLDGLQVGRDTKGAVGEYDAPFEFAGRIESISIEVANK
ncbi:MAG: arylsulfatase [Planctomycetaceae bacterium]|nr:arylsulfatase [Planctomycetales bacterium]MCB9925102.1 arylsulfatase [Planctomycetaceae bacterium]